MLIETVILPRKKHDNQCNPDQSIFRTSFYPTSTKPVYMKINPLPLFTVGSFILFVIVSLKK